MGKINLILALAHSGISTAVIQLTVAANKAEKAGDTKGAKKNRDLARILDAADKGISSYMASDEDE